MHVVSLTLNVKLTTCSYKIQILDIIKYLNFIWAFHACWYSGFPLSFTIMGNWIHDWSVNLFWFPLYFLIKWLVAVITEYLKFFFSNFVIKSELAVSCLLSYNKLQILKHVFVYLNILFAFINFKFLWNRARRGLDLIILTSSSKNVVKLHMKWKILVHDCESVHACQRWLEYTISLCQ